MTPRIAILGSGKGSNYRSIAEAVSNGSLHAEIRIVLSDVADAGILDLARSFHHRSEAFHPGPFKTRMGIEEEKALAQRLRDEQVDIVVLAGFMRMVKHPLLDAFPHAIVNIHPSLLPAFPGLRAWQQALDAHVVQTGCTVHYVDSGMDTGEIILQSPVPVLPDDTPESLHARIQEAEHAAYPEALRRVIARKFA